MSGIDAIHALQVCFLHYSTQKKTLMMEIQKALESVILNPKYADYLAILKAARNGAVYGTKVRFPHALV
jgi:hypothetical protein